MMNEMQEFEQPSIDILVDQFANSEDSKMQKHTFLIYKCGRLECMGLGPLQSTT